MRSTLLLCLIAFAFCGCYRMPEDGEYSVCPATNNPSVVGKDRSSFMPGGSAF